DGSRLHGLNASGRSPAAWEPRRFNDRRKMPTTGWDSVTVPGAVSAWTILSQRFGKLAFADLFEFAIRYASDGYMVSPTIARLWHNQVPGLRDVPGFAEHFLPRGRAPQAGEKFLAPAHARTLARIAETKGEAFYRGDLAEKMVAHSRRHGGVLTLDDLAAHAADWVAPLAHDYRGYALSERPPNGPVSAGQMALGILESFALAALPVDSADSLHLQMEAMKLAFADVYAYVSDPAAMRVQCAELLNKEYLRSRARLIDMKKAQNPGSGRPRRGGALLSHRR